MKLTFFLIAIGLILLRLCYPSMSIWLNRHGQGTMITRGDNYIEGIWWSGKYRLGDDDRSIAELSPGGYLKFRENDTTMTVESDLDGKLRYTLYDGREKLQMNDSGRNFVAAQLQKMIRLGFFGEERAERIYRNGGAVALLAELSKIRMEGGRDPYLDLLLHADSLAAPQRIALLRLADSSSDMGLRQHVLERFGRDQLRDSAVAHEWLSAVGHIEASFVKKGLLLKHLDSGLTADRFDSVVAITSRLGSDGDQQDIYKSLADLPGMRRHDSVFAQPWLGAVGELQQSYMKKDLLLLYLRPADSAGGPPVPADQFDTVLAIVGRFGSSVDEQEVYKVLSDLPGKTDGEWTGLLRAAGTLNEDYLKSELLLRIAANMPRTDSLRAAYRLVARSIRDDAEYGRTMRAVDGN